MECPWDTVGGQQRNTYLTLELQGGFGKMVPELGEEEEI